MIFKDIKNYFMYVVYTKEYQKMFRDKNMLYQKTK